MAIKLTKNELKSQKESLKMFKRYLPTLQLKKQQLQTEIRGIESRGGPGGAGRRGRGGAPRAAIS
jgi:vacuolar-type H+-ATPase subunit D/Vma8